MTIYLLKAFRDFDLREAFQKDSQLENTLTLDALVTMSSDFIIEQLKPFAEEVELRKGYYSSEEEARVAAERFTEEAYKAWVAKNHKTNAFQREIKLYPELKTEDDFLREEIFGVADWPEIEINFVDYLLEAGVVYRAIDVEKA